MPKVIPKILFFPVFTGLLMSLMGKAPAQESPWQLSYPLDAPLILCAIPLNFWVQNEFQKLKTPDPEKKGTVLFTWGREWNETNYSKMADHLGTLALAGFMGGTLAYSAWHAFSVHKRTGFYTEAVIYLEALGYSSLLNLWVRSRPLHPRPLVFAENTPTRVRENGEASSGFYSGHSSSAFLSATFLTLMLQKHRPGAPGNLALSLGSYALAAGIAYSRVQGGYHYMEDVAVGAVMGSAFGYIFPKIHEKNLFRGKLSLLPGIQGFSALVRF